MQPWIYIVAGVLGVAIVIYLIVRSRRSSNGGGGGNSATPTAPGGVQLVSSGSCQDWSATLQWNASTGSAPITYDWAIYAEADCSTTSCSGTPLVSGSTQSTSAAVDISSLTGFTSYYASVLAKNQWGSSDPAIVLVKTGGPFVVDKQSLAYEYDPVGNELVLIGEGNSALLNNSLAGTLSINNGAPISSSTNLYSQDMGLAQYILDWVVNNDGADYAGIYVFSASCPSLAEVMGQSGEPAQAFTIYQSGNNLAYFSAPNTYNATAQSGVSVMQTDMLNPSVSSSLAAVLAAPISSGCVYVYAYNNGQRSAGTFVPVAYIYDGQLCPSASNNCANPPPAASFGLVFTKVPALAAGDSLVFTVTGGNSSTGQCATVLSPIVIQGSAPSMPTNVALN